ncbi:hypothetical protein CGQ39_20015 (plasmid) [Clostridium botulinum]|nr:hypothetical protein [Clostridium botulinum]QDY23201.1 hypothetical protein CGQ39_20015 [Clostridium botulinum]
MICWDCGKEITHIEDEFSCDICEVTLCRECYSKKLGYCEECLDEEEDAF